MSHFNYKKMIETYTQPFTFIHIGKTGGSTVGSFLKKHISIKEIHNQKPVYNPNTKYIIWIRDPIQRFISAFYMSYGIINDNLQIGGKAIYDENGKFKRDAWSTEYIDLINYFKTPNNLALALSSTHPDNDKAQTLLSYTNTGIGFQHMKAGHAWYLLHNDFIHKAKDNIIFVGTQENLQEDLEKLKGLLNIPRYHQPENKRVNTVNYDKYISQEGIANLKKFYEDDYTLIKILKDYGLIDKINY